MARTDTMYSPTLTFVPARTSAAVSAFAKALYKKHCPPPGLVNPISQTRKVKIR